MCNDNEKLWRIWRGFDLWFQNWHKQLDEYWLEHCKISYIYTLMGCFWIKFIMFELKKYRRAIFHDAREWCKIWNNSDLWFGKWREEFGTFSPEHMKVSKLGLLLGPFIQRRKCVRLKFTRVLCIITMKNNTKFKKELTCLFKVYMNNLTNFVSSTQKYQEFTL